MPQIHKALFFSLILAALNSVGINAQSFKYSNPEQYGLISSFNIIGRVKDKIIIWETNKDHPLNSKILIYDNDMKIVNRVATDLIKQGGNYTIDFVAGQDSFKVIYQHMQGNKLICEIASYDSKGENLGIQQIDSVSLNSQDEFNQNAFTIIKSKNNADFVLCRADINENQTVKFYYQYFAPNLTSKGAVLLPYYLGASTLEGLLLDNDSNIILALSSRIDSNFILGVYKINAVNNNVVNTLKKLPRGNIIANSFNLWEHDKNYLVCAGWQQDSSGNIIFWKMDNNLDDIYPCKKIADNSLSDSLLNHLKVFKMSAFEMNNHLNIFFRSEDNYQLNANAAIERIQPGFVYPTTDSPNMIALQRAADISNSMGYYNRINVGYDIQRIKEAPDKYTLVSLSFNTQKNDWTVNSFDGNIEPPLVSFVNSAAIIETGNYYTILFEQLLTGKKSGIGYVTLTPDNKYTHGSLTLTHLKYQLLLNNIVQTKASEIIAPVSYQNKMVFARINFN